MNAAFNLNFPRAVRVSDSIKRTVSIFAVNSVHLILASFLIDP